MALPGRLLVQDPPPRRQYLRVVGRCHRSGGAEGSEPGHLQPQPRLCLRLVPHREEPGGRVHAPASGREPGADHALPRDGKGFRPEGSVGLRDRGSLLRSGLLLRVQVPGRILDLFLQHGSRPPADDVLGPGAAVCVLGSLRPMRGALGRLPSQRAGGAASREPGLGALDFARPAGPGRVPGALAALPVAPHASVPTAQPRGGPVPRLGTHHGERRGEPVPGQQPRGGRSQQGPLLHPLRART